MESPHRSPHRVAIGLYALLLMALSSACAGIVAEPTDETVATSSVKFWGYTLTPGEPVRLEALSSTYELLTTSTSSSTPTHTGGSTGYYYELWYYAPALPVRFRKGSPYPSYWRGWFRVVTAGGTAITRQQASNGGQSAAESLLTRFWFTHTNTTAGVIRIDVHN